MKIEMFYAVAHKKTGHIVDARNAYDWEDVGSIIVDEEATDDEIWDALTAANIPTNALCVSVRHLS